MQFESTSIPHAITKLLKRRASISSLQRSRGFCRKTSAVAKVHYQKQQPREVALNGHKCLQKLQGAKGSEVEEDVHARLRDSTSKAGPSVKRVQNSSSFPEKDALPKRISHSHKKILSLFETTKEDDFLKEGITKHTYIHFIFYFFQIKNTTCPRITYASLGGSC